MSLEEFEFDLPNRTIDELLLMKQLIEEEIKEVKKWDE